MIVRTTLLAAAALPLAACVIVVDAGGPDSGDFQTSFVADADEYLPAESELSAFTTLTAAAGTEVTLRPGDAFRIVLDDVARQRTVFDAEGDTLRITCRQSGRRGSCVRGDRGEVTVYAPSIAGLRASSGAVLTIADGFAEQPSLTARVSSGGDLDARALPAATVDASASSGGSMLVTATRRIDASASSGGSVRYWGDAEGDLRESSGGNISRAR